MKTKQEQEDEADKLFEETVNSAREARDVIVNRAVGVYHARMKEINEQGEKRETYETTFQARLKEWDEQTDKVVILNGRRYKLDKDI